MWVTGLLTTLPLLVAAVWRWASAEEQMARRAEALADSAAAPRRRLAELTVGRVSGR